MRDHRTHRTLSPPGFWLESGLAVLDAAGGLLEANDAMRGWLGLDGNQIPGTVFWDLLTDRCPTWRPGVHSLRQRLEPFTRVQWQLSMPGETNPRWFLLELARGAPGMFVRIASCLPPRPELAESSWDTYLGSDLARRDLFVRLLRAESRLEQLTEYWPGVVFGQRADGSFEFISAQAESLTGVAPSQWQRQSHWFWQVVHEADASELERQMQQAARTGRPVTTTFRIRHLQSGRVSYVLEHRQPLTSPGGLLLGYEGVWLDVTRQTIAERRLSSAAWKETLAVLTMGLAHDFGNVMAGIHSLSESFLDQLAAEHPFREGLELIKNNALQANQLVRRIIDLHVGRLGERNYHDLNEVLGELSDLVRKVVPRRIQIEVRPAPGQLPVYVDVVEFRQTIINLTLNAAEAMPEKGTLSLGTSRHTAWPAPGHMEGVVPRLPCLCLTVQDTGRGIKSRHLRRIFDPFFTTKSANKGSGLGLYNVRFFAEKHDGAISVESVENQGTTFRLWLPEADFSESDHQSARIAEAPARRLTLLLLGAPGRLLDETAELLRTRGYHVVMAIHPDQALARLRARDCICSGIVVLMEADDTGTLDLLDTVRREHPMLKVILKPMGRERDDLRAAALQHSDLVVPASAPDQVFLDQLRGLLQTEA
jgi:PAS domain S-box-containing protein